MYLQVTYDSAQFYFDNQKIHDYITSLPGVTNWWHYLSNVYILRVDGSNEKNIADAIIKEFGGLRFFITKIDINVTNGVLPQEAWSWINNESKKSRGYLKIKAQPPKTLDDILRFANGEPAVVQRKPMTVLDLFANKKK